MRMTSAPNQICTCYSSLTRNSSSCYHVANSDRLDSFHERFSFQTVGTFYPSRNTTHIVQPNRPSDFNFLAFPKIDQNHVEWNEYFLNKPVPNETTPSELRNIHKRQYQGSKASFINFPVSSDSIHNEDKLGTTLYLYPRRIIELPTDLTLEQPHLFDSIVTFICGSDRCP